MDDGYGFGGVDEATIRRERSKARELRRTRWWQQKIAQRTCYYCGKQTPAEELTMDHIVPLARGGRSTKNNLASACKECNNLKKTMLPMEWQEYMDRLDRQ